VIKTGNVVALAVDVPANSMKRLKWCHRGAKGKVIDRTSCQGRAQLRVEFEGAPYPIWVWSSEVIRIGGVV
jgi:hypothetical protein